MNMPTPGGIEFMLQRCKAHGKFTFCFSDRTPVCTGASIVTSCQECCGNNLAADAWEHVDYYMLSTQDSATLGMVFMTQAGATKEHFDKALAMVQGAEAAMRRPMTKN